MKNIYLMLCILLLLSSSCKKNESTSKELYGTWKLTAALADIGNGKGKYEAVTGKPKYLALHRSGEVSGDAINGLISFKVLDSVTMEMNFKTYNQPVIYRYTLAGDLLTLNPPCFEGCGLKFVRN